MEEYKYEPLNLDCAAIRLLRLHHGLRGPISCELFQAELHRREHTVSYEALSYAWGSPNRTGSIIVNGCHMTVTLNLHQALLHLRQEDEDRVLWVDAVCIDQANNKEKGHQVAQMGGIYKEADRVIFRLGRGSYETDTFMDSLQLLQQTSMKLGCRDWSRQDARWENIWARSQSCSKVYYSGLESVQKRGLEEILARPWFRRVWILQEVAFAKAGIVSCGRKAVSARLFSLAPLLLRVTPDAHCQSVIDLMPSPWRETSRWSRSQTLHVLLIESGGSDATDPRHLVYALRAMSADLRDTTTLMPDYGKCEQDLVRDVYLYIYSYEPEFLEWRKRPRSMRELVASLRELHGKNLVPTLLKIPPMCKDLKKIIKGRGLLVDQGTLRSAAQYDRDGELVELLLRYRGGELTVDSEAIIYVAENSSVPLEILETFFRFNTQIIVTEKMLVAAAKNSRSSDMAMGFLLSRKTEDYNNIAAIVDAIMSNPCNDTREETIRILLRQRDKDIAIASAILTRLAGHWHPHWQLRTFFEIFPDYLIAPESAIVAALKDSFDGQRCLETFLTYCPSQITIAKDILRTAAQLANGADTVRLLFENPAVQNPLSRQEQFAALSPYKNQSLIHFLLYFSTMVEESCQRKLSMPLLATATARYQRSGYSFGKGRMKWK